MNLQFVGANPTTDIQVGRGLAGKVNYLRGRDHTNWHTNLPTYADITYSQLFPGTDLTYAGSDGQLEGFYHLAAGADPSVVRWRYSGSDIESLTIDEAGNLNITVCGSGLVGPLTLQEAAPAAWQDFGGRRVAVDVGYVIGEDGAVGFELGKYDRSSPLTIDPTLTYSTYLGGYYGDGASAIAVDAAGNMYFTGTTESSDFPIVNGYQPIWGGDSDAYVAKLSADGSTLVYSTFLGGGAGDNGQAISVDSLGRATVGGSTISEDFPTSPDAYQIIFGGSGDLFMARLSVDGSEVVFSTYYGNAGVEVGDDFTTDSEGNVYFTGYFEAGLESWALVGELSADGSNLLFVRSLGGHVPGPGDENANSHGTGIRLDSQENIYVTGDTRAADFPTTPGAYRTSIQAFEDGFVTKLAPGGQQILASTYIPGGVSEYPRAIALDPAGNAYITGWTDSADFPTTPGAFDPTFGDQSDAFVTKLDPALSQLGYSTFLGGPTLNGAEDIGYGIAADALGSAYIVGYTESPDFPTRNPIQASLLGPADAFITKLNAGGTDASYSTYMGGTNAESAAGIVVNIQGNAYICGGTGSTDFPTVNPFQSTAHGSGDSFVIRIFDSSGMITPTRTPTGTPPTTTPTRTATPCTPEPNYRFRQFTGVSMVPGTTDIGNHCDDCMSTISLPFAFRFYGQSYSSVNVSSNGNIQFVSGNPEPFDLDTCEVGYPQFNYAVMPYFSDMDTTNGGIYTSVSGSAPNRIFNIEWRGCVFDPITFKCTDHVDFEARLYENSPTEQIDFVYQQVDTFQGIPASVGVQEGTGSHFTQYSCLQPVLSPGLLITFYRNTCAIATPTPTGSAPTHTPTRTGTPTPNPCRNVTSWRSEPHAIYPHGLAAAAVINNRLYVFGGSVVSPTPSPNAVERFDPATGQWTQLASAPQTIVFNQAVALDNIAYVVGNTYEPEEGFIMAYDTSTNTWARRATLPETLLTGAMAAYMGKIYIFGGSVPGQLPSDRTYEYDPAANTVIRKANMPTYQSEIGAATVGNKIYVLGGYQYIHYAYDPVADSWSTIATPLTPSFSNAGVFSMNGEVWIIGGRDNFTRRGYPPGQEVQIYDPAANHWRYGPALITPRYYSTAVGALNGRGYVVGGVDLPYDPSTGHELNSVESITYSGCATGTSVTRTPTATATRGAATTTPRATAATATPCLMTFSDVQPTDYFYEAVRHLYCRGVVSGYGSVFLPYNDTTRGQLAKIVVLAEGWAIYVPPTPTFRDVPANHAFHQYVETAYNHEIISGYSCGPTCLEFRPFANVTRGQLGKIIVQAEGWELYTPAAPTFRDVATSHTFFAFIETAYQHGIISGYSCGANCLEFRPGSSATRGQICKIVYLAVTQP